MSLVNDLSEIKFLPIKTQIFYGAVFILCLIFGIGAAWLAISSRIENSELKTQIATLEKTANDKTVAANAEREKATKLEGQIEEISRLTKKQDEELKLSFAKSDDARSDVDRARAVRAISVTRAELCAELAEAGHGCE